MITQNDPDITLHELGKFVRLAIETNPTILDKLVFDGYKVVHPAGRLLVDRRAIFLSNAFLKAFGGHAIDRARHEVR